MENSSSSKTRSPARVLAALLAVVMLFIVMPVLPAGAEGKVNSITFVDAKSAGAGRDVFFDPGSSNTVNACNATQTETDFAWSDTDSLQWRRLEGGSDGSVKITVKDGGTFGTDDWDSKTFTFGVFTAKVNAVVSYATSADAQADWKPLSSTRTVVKNGKECKVYTVPQGDMGQERPTDIYIKVTSEEATHTVTFTVENGATVKAGTVKEESKDIYNSGKVTVTEKETLYIDAKSAKPGYTPVVSVPGDLTDDLKETDGLYTLTNITRDINVDVTLEKAQYTVVLDEGSKNKPGYTVTIKNPNVNYKEQAEFTVETADGYNDPTVTVKGAKELAPVTDYSVTKSGAVSTYTIFTVTENLTISVTAGSEIYHTVNVIQDDGFTVDRDYDSVKHGNNFVFTVKPAEGWETTTPIVTANGTRILPGADGNETKGWTYTVKITDDTTILVSNFKRKTYTVTVVNDMEKYSLTNYPSSVEHGQGFTFTLNLTTAYEAKTGITVNGTMLDQKKLCDVDVTPDGTNARSYTIKVTNVKGDLSLSFGGIDIKKYNVTVQPETDDSNGLFTVDKKESSTETKSGINHGSGVSFTIKPKEGCRIENVSVYGSEGVALSGVMVDNKDGTYSIGNVTDNYTIKVRAVAVKFTIAIQSSAATTVADDKAPMNALVVTKTYTTIKNGGIVTYKNGVFELKLPTVTRPGHVFDGWTRLDGSEIVDDTLRFYGDNDQAETVVANWKVNVAAGESAYFVVQLNSLTFKDGTTRFEADFKTNAALDKNPENAGASVLSHGFFYARSEAEYNAALKDLSKVIEKLENGVDQKLTNLDTGVAYYLHDDGDGVDAFKGGTFNLSLSNTQKGTAVGSAWVLVSINGETYLFVSAMQTVA